MRSDPDERLVALVRAGESAAFEELYDRYTPGLLSFCRHLLGTLDEAEDAVQHTFLAAHRALLRDDREIHLKAWLYAIARNRCLSMLRARRERVGFDDELDTIPSTAGLAAEVEQREDLREMLADLQRLPEDQRSALVLSELGAHTHDEIGEVLGVRCTKVKALVFQARESLAAARTARETPCVEIREELATARGGALRRGNLRRHLEDCAGCRAFRDEVHHQRAAFSILLPVAPSLALKQAVLGGAAVTAGGGAALAGGGTIAAGGAAAAGGKAATAKLLTVVVAAGGAGGGGYVAVNETQGGHDVPSAVAESAATPHRAYAHEVTAESTPLPPSAATPPTPEAAPARPAKRHAKPRAKGHVVFASAKAERKPKKAKRRSTAPRAHVLFVSGKAPKKPKKHHQRKFKAQKPAKPAAPPPPPPQPAAPPPPPPAAATPAVTPITAADQKRFDRGRKKGHFKHLHKPTPGRKQGHVEFQGVDDDHEGDDDRGKAEEHKGKPRLIVVLPGDDD